MSVFFSHKKKTGSREFEMVQVSYFYSVLIPCILMVSKWLLKFQLLQTHSRQQEKSKGDGWKTSQVSHLLSALSDAPLCFFSLPHLVKRKAGNDQLVILFRIKPQKPGEQVLEGASSHLVLHFMESVIQVKPWRISF